MKPLKPLLFILLTALYAAASLSLTEARPVQAQACRDALGNPVDCPSSREGKHKRPTATPLAPTSTATPVPATPAPSAALIPPAPSGGMPATSPGSGHGQGSPALSPWLIGLGPLGLIVVVLVLVRLLNAGPMPGWPIALGSTTHDMLHDGDKTHTFQNEPTVDAAGVLESNGGRPTKN